MSATSAFSASSGKARNSTRSPSAARATRALRSARSSARASPPTRSSTRSRRIVDTYLRLRASPRETFLDAYRRVGETPFREALYAAAVLRRRRASSGSSAPAARARALETCARRHARRMSFAARAARHVRRPGCPRLELRRRVSAVLLHLPQGSIRAVPGHLHRYAAPLSGDARLSRRADRPSRADRRAHRRAAAAADARARPAWRALAVDPDRCCHFRKVEPLARALAPFDAWITGRKRYPGGLARSHPRLRSRRRAHQGQPAGRLDGAEIAAYARAHELPAHPLVARGFPSIGCMPCTTRSRRRGCARRALARPDKTECGIHAASSLELTTGH